MSLRIIYGTAGTGKSTYMLKQIQEKLEKNASNTVDAFINTAQNSEIENKEESLIKIITPEQFSFTLEQKLLEFSHCNSVLTAEVVTFNRMAYRILEEVGGKTKNHLSSSGRAMLLDDILLTQKNDFTFLGKTDENVDMIATQLTELKKHNVKLDTLKQITNDTKDNYLKKKLQDVYKIYEAYTKKIENGYIDENDGLTILAEKIDESLQFKDCDIYLDEFAGFTLQEYEIIRKLMKQSKSITVTICADNLDLNTNQEQDLFYANKQTAKRLMKIAKEENIKIEEPINLNTNTKLNNIARFKTPELGHLAENLQAPFYKKYEKDVNNIQVFLANNPYSEIEHVAIEITKLVKEKSYHYEDISIITKDLETYGSLCKAIFKRLPNSCIYG